MDSITHIAIGACLGEAFMSKKLGKKAMLWGALAQSAPDIDVITALWMNAPDRLLAHRGFTHSLLFCLLLTPFLALIAERWHRPHNISLRRWIMFFGISILIHILLDGFNNYGTGWFEPFSHYRISFNTIFVADPFFSVGPVLAFIALLILKRQSNTRRKWWLAGFGMSILYLLYGVFNKIKIDTDVKDILQKQKIVYSRYFTTPAPLQNWLWYVVAGNDSGYYVGYRSLFDSKKEISFQYFPRNYYLLNAIKDKEDLQQLIRFSQQFYTIDKRKDTLIFNDIRFGQIAGWEFPRNKFVFHYFLEHPTNNTLVVQRGRFVGWDKDAIKSLLKRIHGD